MRKASSSSSPATWTATGRPLPIFWRRWRVGLASAARLAVAGIAVEVLEAADEVAHELRASTFHPPLWTCWTVTDLAKDADRVDVVDALDERGRGDLVVGADVARSVVWDAADIGFPGATYPSGGMDERVAAPARCSRMAQDTSFNNPVISKPRGQT